MEKKSVLYYAPPSNRSWSDRMVRRTVLACLLLATLSILFPAQAMTPESWKLEWEIDLADGYITTRPVIDNETVYVRTSGFWTGEERPQVFAFSTEGEERWNRTSATTVQHDMSPLLLLPSGVGPCGSWPDLIAVGWADGTVEVLRANDGAPLWNRTSTTQGWGITGAIAQDGDHLVVPTRTGMMRVCIANGELDFEVELGLGWRNGILTTDDAFWQGDESGNIWKVSRDGTSTLVADLGGSIRHAPIQTSSGIFVHVQRGATSTIHLLNAANNSVVTIHQGGASPAMPVSNERYVVAGDSSSLSIFDCERNCSLVSEHPTTTNGELVWASAQAIWYPVNQPNGNWAVTTITENGTIASTDNFSTPHDGYGTAAPSFGENRIVMGNDAGVLMMYVQQRSVTPDPQPYDWVPFGGAIVLISLLSIGAYASSINRHQWGWRLVMLVLLVSTLAITPDLSSRWSQSLIENSQSDTSEIWNETWPESWRETQVVIIEIDGEQQVIGGLDGYETALDLTLAAADEASWEVNVESTELGSYVVSINGEEGSGWEYFLNGERAGQSSDRQSVSDSIVLHWRLVRR